MDLDDKYEFNAPKYVDFTKMNDSFDTSDHWFDEKPGDEGGIDVDFGEEMEIGFTKATAAISAALAPTDDEQQEEQQQKQNEQLDTQTNSIPNKNENTINENEGMDAGNNINNNEHEHDKNDAKNAVENDRDNYNENDGDKNGDDYDENKGDNNKENCNTSYTIETHSSSYTIESGDAPHNTSYTIDSTGADSNNDTLPKIGYELENVLLPRKTNTPKTSYTPKKTFLANNSVKPTPKTPKTRFQPLRKSTVRPVNYDGSSRNAPKRKELDSTPFKDIVKKARITPYRSSAQVAVEKIKNNQNQKQKRTTNNEKRRLKEKQGAARNFGPVRKRNFVNGGTTNNIPQPSSSNKSFAKNLRQDTIYNFKNKPTKPVPFNFVLPEKLKVTEQKNNWHSMAEQTTKFQNKTPLRFRTKSSVTEQPKVSKPMQITKPVTPYLMTRKRTRQNHAESSKDMEEKMVEEMKSYQFKATELNPKIIEMKGMYGVKTVQPSTSTSLKPFSFQMEGRSNFKKKHEAADETIVDKSKKSDQPLKPTVPKPFSFEGRDRERFQKKDEKIKNLLAEEKKLHDFQARLMPSHSPEVLPDVKTKAPTKPIPFGVYQYSEVYQQKMEEKLRKEEEEDRARRMFKAQECSVTVSKPFQPAKGLRPATNVSNFELHSEARAAERSKFDTWLKEKEKRDEEARLENERVKQEEEEEEIKQLRKDIVHKANPIRSFKPVEIKKSDVPLTEAKTPLLEVRRRAVFKEVKKN